MLSSFFRALIWILASGAPISALGTTSQAHEKASYLVNCAHFIGWPLSAFASPEAPFTICVLGENPFGNSLEELTRDAKIRGRHVQIVYTDSLEKAMECHLLFMSEATRRLCAVLRTMEGQSIVTVGETDSFLAAGGMIALKSERPNVRLRINWTMVQAAKVTVSSKLMRIAAQR